jgi:hypothetical protein
MGHQLSKLSLIIILSICVACVPIDYEGNLINGYKLFKTNSISIAIISSGGSVLIPEEHITDINAKGDFIFGRIEPLTPEQQQLVKDERHPGYFIVNTRTRFFQSGLKKEEWLDELRKIGIETEPVLQQPSSFRNESALITALKAIIFGQR